MNERFDEKTWNYGEEERGEPIQVGPIMEDPEALEEDQRLDVLEAITEVVTEAVEDLRKAVDELAEARRIRAEHAHLLAGIETDECFDA
jgi:hypothetical protein